MIKMRFAFESQSVEAVRKDTHWEMTITDRLTGAEATGHLSDHELAAITALQIGGDDLPIADLLYPLAEAALARITNGNRDLRIIP